MECVFATVAGPCAAITSVANATSGSHMALDPPCSLEETVRALRFRVAAAIGRGAKQITLFDAHTGQLLIDGPSLHVTLQLSAGDAAVSFCVGASDAVYQEHLVWGTEEKRGFSVVAEVEFPEPKDISINMMPFVMGDVTSIPEEYQDYWPLIEQCLDVMDKTSLNKHFDGIAYLTINEGPVATGVTQRRAGLHVEAPGSLASHGEHVFDTVEDTHGGGDIEFNRFRDGLYMASTISDSCKVWDVTITEPREVVGLTGDVEHLRGLLGEGTQLSAGDLVWITDLTPHEAVPCTEAKYRQFFRLITPSLSTWYVRHNTRNRLGCRPDVAKTRTTGSDKFGSKLGAGARPSDVEPYATVLRQVDGLEPLSSEQAELEFVRQALCADLELTHGEQTDQVIRFASEKAKLLPEFRSLVLEAAAVNCDTLGHLPEHLRVDPDIFAAGFNAHWKALKHAQDTLVTRSVALEAVHRSWQALQLLPKCFRGDREIFAVAFEQDWQSIKVACGDICEDPDIVREAVRRSGGEAMSYASSKLCADRSFMLEIVGISSNAVHFAALALLEDRNFIMEATIQGGNIYARYHYKLPYRFRVDRDIVLETLKRHPDAFRSLPAELRGDPSIVVEALKVQPSLSKIVDGKVCDDPEVAALLSKLRS